MRKIKTKLIITVILFLFYSCSTNIKKEYKTLFHGNGKLIEKNIDITSFLTNGQLKNEYFNSINVYRLNSVSFENDNPDKTVFKGTKVILNFDVNPIVFPNNQPEYYALLTIYHATLCINYYNKLFNNKLDFNSQNNYKDVDIYLGNASFLSDPKDFIFVPNTKPSPTLVYHEIGHRAFWLLEDSMNINI